MSITNVAKRRAVVKKQILSQISMEKKKADYLLEQKGEQERLQVRLKEMYDVKLEKIMEHSKVVEQVHQKHQQAVRNQGEEQVRRQQQVEQKYNKMYGVVLYKVETTNSASCTRPSPTSSTRRQRGRGSSTKCSTTGRGNWIPSWPWRKKSCWRASRRSVRGGGVQFVVETTQLNKEKGLLEKIGQSQVNRIKSEARREAMKEEQEQKFQKKMSGLIGKMSRQQEKLEGHVLEQAEHYEQKQKHFLDKKRLATGFQHARTQDHLARIQQLEHDKNAKIQAKRDQRQQLLTSTSNMRRELNRQKHHDFILNKDRQLRLDNIKKEHLIEDNEQRRMHLLNRKTSNQFLQAKQRYPRAFYLLSKDKFHEAELERNLINDVSKAIDYLYEPTNYEVNQELLRKKEEKEQEKQKIILMGDLKEEGSQKTMLEKFAEKKQDEAISIFRKVLDEEAIEAMVRKPKKEAAEGKANKFKKEK